VTEPPRDNPPSPGRVVPVFALTGGRTRSSGRALPMESLVTLAPNLTSRTELQYEYRAILELARHQPVSLAEIGAELRVPGGVARVLVTDLAEAGYLDVHTPQTTGDSDRPDAQVLTRLLEGLRAR
jgi:hypothetical protein